MSLRAAGRAFVDATVATGRGATAVVEVVANLFHLWGVGSRGFRPGGRGAISAELGCGRRGLQDLQDELAIGATPARVIAVFHFPEAFGVEDHVKLQNRTIGIDGEVMV